MTQDEIIRMAREASNTPIDHHATPDLFGVRQIERFAAIVAAHEREACAKVCDKYAADPDDDHNLSILCAAAIRERSANARARGEK